MLYTVKCHNCSHEWEIHTPITTDWDSYQTKCGDCFTSGCNRPVLKPNGVIFKTRMSEAHKYTGGINI